MLLVDAFPYSDQNTRIHVFQTKYLEPGQSYVSEGSNGSKVKVQATAGPVLGPPWQRPENG